MKKNPYFNFVNGFNVKQKRLNVINMITFALLLQFFSLSALFAQNAEEITVKGKIVDQNGEPLIGVNIMASKSATGTITDMDGNFTIVVPKDEELKVTYVGFTEQIIPVEGRVIINITLKEGASELQDVVVVGYGTVKRANLVGSVSSIKAEELEDFPVTSLSSVLEGKMPGVSINPAQPTGRPGAATRIVIRGADNNTFGRAGDLAKDPNPLYVVDGFILDQEAFDLLDPSEIESISVLKDASAAVYGARGANGVVLVKTKRGKEGKMRISYSGSLGLGDATMQTDMMSAYEQAKFLSERYKNESGYDNVSFSNEELEALKSVDNNWLEDAWKLSTNNRHSINVSGGTDKVRYFGGGTYVYTTGNFDNLDVTKYNYRLGLDVDVTKNLNASVTLGIDNKIVKIPYVKTDGEGNTMENVFEQLLRVPKWYPHHNNGLLVATPGDIDDDSKEYVYATSDVWSPFALFETNSFKSEQNKGNTLNTSLKYQVPFIKGLEASASYSRRENHSYGKQYLVPYVLYRFGKQGDYKHLISNEVFEELTIKNSERIYESYDYGSNYQFNANLNYSKTIGLHDISAFVTYEQTESSGFDFAAWREKQLLRNLAVQNGFDISTAENKGSMTEGGRMSGVGRLNYSYANKYIVESTVRLESSTKFSEEERTGLFPSVALGWVLSEEPFISENVNWIDFLKLRTSVGRTGVDYLGSFEYLIQYTASSKNYLMGTTETSGLSPRNYGLASTGVSWETTDMYNGGIDIKLFNSKLSISADVFYYYKFDILDQRTASFPVTAGITKSVSENISRAEIWGYDMQIGYNDKVGKDFSWGVSGNFNFVTNRVLDMVYDQDIIKGDYRYPIGRSYMATQADEGYYSNGIIRTQAQADAINAAAREEFGHDYIIMGEVASPGMLYLQDIGRKGGSGDPTFLRKPDGIVDGYDQDYITDTNDKFVWKNLLPTSVSMNASWKDLAMRMQWTMAYGTTSSLVDKAARQGADWISNGPSFWSDYYTENNTDAEYPSPEEKYYDIYSAKSTFWLRDEYLLRLRELNISYKLPQSLVKRWGMSSLRVYFAGTNLWTPISTFDYKEDAISKYYTYPFLKTFNFGVNMTL